MRLTRLVGALAAWGLVACSADVAPPSGPRSESSPAPRATPEPPPAPAGTPAATQPLVLAVHPSLPPVRISLPLARRVLSGDVDNWRPLDGRARPLRVAYDARPADLRGRDSLLVLPAHRLVPTLSPVRVAGVDPLLAPRRYPLRVAGPVPGPVTTVTVVGDVMLGRGVETANPVDPLATLRPLRRWLTGADLTVGNLESTLSRAGPPRQAGDSFAARPGVAAGLRDLGVDALSLANNHTGDFGDRALEETLTTLDRAGLPRFGAGRDLAEATRPVVLTRHGVRFGLVGFNAIGETPPATPGSPGALSVRMPPRTGPLDRGDLRHVLRVVRRLDGRVDVVVVLPHWGTQYTHTAEPVQSLVGRRLVGAGADLVVGGHPHWVQGLERVGPAVVAHSLGNFVFDMDFMRQTMEGVTLTATFWGPRLMGVRLRPYVLDSRFAPRPAPPEAAARILGAVWTHSGPGFRP